MATETAPAPAQETLAWEQRQRPKAGIAAIVAGLLLLAANILGTVALQDEPVVLLSDGLRDALGQPISTGQGLLTERAMFLDDKIATILAQSIVTAIGAALIAVVLGLLFRATQARNPQVPRFTLYLALIGPILFALAPLVFQVALALSISDYVDSGQFSTQRAHDAFSGDSLVAAQVLSLPAVFMLAIAFVLVSLNAMRTGLLTKFMGILGCIVGALTVLPLGGSPIVIQSFWLISVGLMLLGVGRVPPAWSTGVMTPWPTQQELREQAEREAKLANRPEPKAPSLKDELGGAIQAPDAPPKAAERPASSTPAGRKRRKRR